MAPPAGRLAAPLGNAGQKPARWQVGEIGRRGGEALALDVRAVSTRSQQAPGPARGASAGSSTDGGVAQRIGEAGAKGRAARQRSSVSIRVIGLGAAGHLGEVL